MLFIPRQPGAPIKDPKHTAAIALAAVVIAALALGPTMYFAGGFGWLDSLAYGLLIGAAVTAFLIVVGVLDRAASRLFRHVFHRSSGSGASAMQAPRHPRRHPAQRPAGKPCRSRRSALPGFFKRLSAVQIPCQAELA